MADSHPAAHGTGANAPQELTDPVDLCTPDGRLNPNAVGWSRRPLHRCNLRGAWGRKKRWEYWCVTTEDHLLSLTYADLDYLGLSTVLFHDLRSGRSAEKGVLLPGALGFRFSETVSGGSVRFRFPGLSFDLLEEVGGTRIVARFRNLRGQRLAADVLVQRLPDHETLNVVVPWSDRRFQFTSKQNTLPAQGEVTLDGQRFDFGPHNQAFGCLDFGRGIWPADTSWNWGSASGIQDGRTVGLQLGGRWTDGTGQTENGLVVDGRLNKIHEDVRFTFDPQAPLYPWRIATPNSGRVELDFVPALQKPLRVNLGLARAQVIVCFGHYSGRVVLDSGETVHVRELFGWAEELRARW